MWINTLDEEIENQKVENRNFLDWATSYGDIQSKRLKDLPIICSRGEFSGPAGFAAKKE